MTIKQRMISLLYRLAAMFVVLVVVGCPPPRPVPVIPDDVPGKCAAMCERLREPDADCPEGKPSEYGTTCESSCEQIYGLGYVWVVGDETSGPVCVIKAPDVEAIRACHVKCASGAP